MASPAGPRCRFVTPSPVSSRNRYVMHHVHFTAAIQETTAVLSYATSTIGSSFKTPDILT